MYLSIMESHAITDGKPTQVTALVCLMHTGHPEIVAVGTTHLSRRSDQTCLLDWKVSLKESKTMSLCPGSERPVSKFLTCVYPSDPIQQIWLQKLRGDKNIISSTHRTVHLGAFGLDWTV